jgi:hypothetical protein
MKIQTALDITALETFKKMEKIAVLERKMQRLSYAPASATAIMALYCLTLLLLDHVTMTPQLLFGFVGILGSMILASNKRIELLQQWTELKIAEAQQ